MKLPHKGLAQHLNSSIKSNITYFSDTTLSAHCFESWFPFLDRISCFRV